MTTKSVPLLYGSRAEHVPWFQREDLLNDSVSSDFGQCEWQTSEAIRYKLAVDGSGRLVHDVATVASPMRRADGFLYAPDTILAMAALVEWQQVTTAQCATLLGCSTRKAYGILWNLHSAGILKKMNPKIAFEEYGGNEGIGSVWAMDKKSWCTEKWFKEIDPLDYALITNGLDPLDTSIGVARGGLRHNLASVDLIIKTMEVSPVCGGWGEPHSRVENFYDPKEWDAEEVSKRRADGVIVSNSGKVILLETTGSWGAATEEITNKTIGWVKAIAHSDLDLHVVFLDMSNPPIYAKMKSRVAAGLHRSESVVPNKYVRDQAIAKVHVANGRIWFPFSRAVSEEFRLLEVATPAKRVIEPLLRDEPEQPDLSKDVVRNTLAGLHTPAWIRNRVSASL